MVFLSDGGDSVRNLQAYLHPDSEHWLDWFHITMRNADFSLFGVFDHFVESLACGMPRKAASIGEETFQISTKGIILSSVSVVAKFKCPISPK